MMIENPQVADSGRYTCRVKANHSENDEITLTVKQRNEQMKSVFSYFMS